MNIKILSIWGNLNIIRSLPAIIAYCVSDNKNIVKKDIERWVHIDKLQYLNYPTWRYLNWLLVYSKQFRNVFYHRMDNVILAKFLSLFYRKLDSLYISTKEIGAGLYISHGFSTIIVAKSIGENCYINQQVTIGYGNHDITPVIGNNVRIGAGAIVIGHIEVGDNSIVGAGAVVSKSVPSNCVMIGNPAFILKRNGATVKECL
jgi:serine O-acetyltransferase